VQQASSRSAALAGKWRGYPNLRHRPYAPAAGRGRLQAAVRRAFVAAGTDELPSSRVYDWAFQGSRRRRRSHLNRRRVWQLLTEIADPIRRVPPHGAWLWKLRQPLDKL
jgi:hypothetical protein